MESESRGSESGRARSADTIDLGPVAAAALRRHSVRAYTDDPVPENLLRAILEPSLSAPSGGNMQPWHIRVLTGPALAALTADMAAALEENPRDVRPNPFSARSSWDPYRTRGFENGEDLYRSIGIPREDKPARYRHVARNLQFFGAPVGLLFTVDDRLGAAQWLDVGILIQTVMLLAADRGLATCPQASWAGWTDTLRGPLGLGENEQIAAGMAMGYEDTSHAINQWRSSRQSFDEAVTLHAG